MNGMLQSCLHRILYVKEDNNNNIWLKFLNSMNKNYSTHYIERKSSIDCVNDCYFAISAKPNHLTGLKYDVKI